jgi:hypothetical protein
MLDKINARFKTARPQVKMSFPHCHLFEEIRNPVKIY